MKPEVHLLFLSNERFPAKLACTIQQMFMCEAFAKAGAEVEMFYPLYYDIPRLSARAIQEYYGVVPNFAIKRLWSLLSLSKKLVDGKKRIAIPFIGGFSLLVSTTFMALNKLLSDRFNQPTVIYSRNVNGAYIFYTLKKTIAREKSIRIVFEVHSLDQQHPRRFFHRLLRDSDALVCISHALKDALIAKYHVPQDRILVAADGVKQSLLASTPPAKEMARKQLDLPNTKIVLYTGQLLPGKGSEVFVSAAASFSDDVLFLVVGGHGHYLERLKIKIVDENLTNVQVTGFVSPNRVPLYQVAADVLVLPPTADHDISAYTSPLKLFEYMAARRPIVASDLPVLAEVLVHNKNALLFQQGDSADLADKIKELLQNDHLSKKLSEQAYADVQTLTWEHRAQDILEFIRKGN